MRLPQEVKIAFDAGPAEVVKNDDIFAISQQLIHEIGADEASAAEHDDRLSRACDRKFHYGRGLQVGEATGFHEPSQQLGTSLRIGDSHVIMAWVEVQALLHGDSSGNILPTVPIEPLCRGAHHLAEALNLLCLIATPGRVAGL